MMDTAEIVEGWLRFQGLSMAQLKRDDRRAHIALARRQVMEYLRGREGWTYQKIGEFLDRDTPTVWAGLGGRPHVPWARKR